MIKMSNEHVEEVRPFYNNNNIKNNNNNIIQLKTFGELGKDVLDLLSRISSFFLSNSSSTKSKRYIFHKLAFCI